MKAKMMRRSVSIFEDMVGPIILLVLSFFSGKGGEKLICCSHCCYTFKSKGLDDSLFCP